MGRRRDMLARSLRDLLTASLRGMGSWCRPSGYVRLVTLSWTLALLFPTHGLAAFGGSRGLQRDGQASQGARSGVSRGLRGVEAAILPPQVSSGSRQTAPQQHRFKGSQDPVLLRDETEGLGGRARRQLQQQAWVKEESNMVGLVKELEGELDASTPCNSTMLEEMRAFFRSIVLIVHCNDEEFVRNTTAFWSKVYSGRLFEHIVFVSSSPDPALGVEARAPRPWRWDWHYSYFGLPKIMARFPDAEGFLWSNDDVIINYWNLLGANKSRIWLPNDQASPETRFFPIDNDTQSRWPEDWPSEPERRMQAAAAWQLLEGHHKWQYRESLGSQEAQVVFQKRVCDFFYIPRRHVETFSFDLLPFFREARVASQVAIPTMFYLLEPPSAFDPVLDNMVYRWDVPQAQQAPRQVWLPHVAAVRPFKVTDAKGQKDALLLLSQRDSCILDQFMNRPKGSA